VCSSDLHESADELRRVYEAFDDTLTGRSPARELSRRLRTISPQGTTEGSLLVPSGYMQLPILQ
jgi:hypothetical protein